MSVNYLLFMMLKRKYYKIKNQFQYFDSIIYMYQYLTAYDAYKKNYIMDENDPLSEYTWSQSYQ